jgi:hypothetical protein
MHAKRRIPGAGPRGQQPHRASVARIVLEEERKHRAERTIDRLG